MASPSWLRRSSTTSMSTGTAAIVLGCLAFVLSRGRDGFDKGLFLGACIALMVIGAYLLGSTTFRRSDRDGGSERSWLPSRDER